jgi:hypothetical protein
MIIFLLETTKKWKENKQVKLEFGGIKSEIQHFIQDIT